MRDKGRATLAEVQADIEEALAVNCPEEADRFDMVAALEQWVAHGSEGLVNEPLEGQEPWPVGLRFVMTDGPWWGVSPPK